MKIIIYRIKNKQSLKLHIKTQSIVTDIIANQLFMLEFATNKCE